MALVCCPHCGHASGDAEFCDACNREIGDLATSSPTAPTQIDLGDGRIVECPFLEQGWPESDRLEPIEVAWQEPRRGRLYAISPRTWPQVRERIEARQRVESSILPPIHVVPAEEGAVVVAEWWDHGQPVPSLASTTTDTDIRSRLAAVLERCQLYGRLMRELHALGCVWLNFDPSAVEIVDGDSRIINLDTGLFQCGKCPDRLRISPQYSPPEVCRFQGERIGPPTDIFQLAMYAYYGLANLLPTGFAGLGLEAFGFKIPALRTYQPALPVGMWPVIARGLNSDPNDRYPTVDEFLNEFESAVRRAFSDTQTLSRQPGVTASTRKLRFEKVLHTARRFARVCGIRLKASQQTRAPNIEVGSLTIAGTAKTVVGTANQDAISVEQLSVTGRTIQLTLVADGVSVSRIGRGEVASNTAACVIPEVIRREATSDSVIDWRVVLERACLEASEKILEQARLELSGQANVADNDVMSTTVVVGIWDGRELHVANAGDSRAYLIRRGVAEQLTVDGDMGTSQLAAGVPPEQVQELGVSAKSLRYCLGACSVNATGDLIVNPERCCPTYSRWVLEPEDIVVLCSDGLVEEGVFLEPEDLAAIAAAGENLTAQQLADQLVAEADRRQRPPSPREPAGFGDNIACVVLRIGKQSASDH